MRFSLGLVRTTALFPLVLGLAGCPMDDAPAPVSPAPAPTGSNTPTSPAGAGPADGGPSPAPEPKATHSGLVSIQDISIVNLPAAGHGLTVSAFFTPLVAPDFEEVGEGIQGCRAWSYDVATRPPPPEQDQGELEVDGATHGPLRCRFVAGRGYVCPTATGAGAVTVATPTGPTTRLTIAGGAFAATDVGRYLQLGGATTAANNGAFAIVGVPSATEIVVANPRASAESFAGSFTVLAGAGPTPNDLYDPFADGARVAIGLAPGASSAFDVPKTTLTAGASFALESGSQARITAIPVTGEAVTLSCGTAAACNHADGTIVRITATDADVTNASPVAMPPPRSKLVEIQCLRTGAGSESVTVPAAAMDLVRAAHAVSPITRIRTAFMRDGLALVKNPAPKVPNTTYLATGHGYLGFTRP